MNRWLETDTQKTARNIINILNESAAGMVKKEINKDKPEEAPKNKKVALEKRITRAAIKGKKPESKNAKMPEKTAKKVVKEELEPEAEKSIEDQIADLQDYLNSTPEIAEDEKEAIQAEIDDLISQLGEDEMKDNTLEEDLEAELFEKEKLNETGEWDDNDDEMKIWKEELIDKAEYIANEIHGSIVSVSGFDKYQGPVAIISTPIHGDVQLWFDNEDDTGLSLLCKIAHVGWIQGGANYISDRLSREVIPEDEIINESEKLNEKINHANDDINRAIANPNLGKNRDKIHAAGYEVTDYGLIKNPKTKKRVDPSQYSREEKKKVDFKGMLDSERKNNQGKFYPEYVPKGLKTGKGRGYAQADKDDMEAQNGISQNIKDYKDAVKTRDENRRAAERSRKNIPHYEKKVKDAQKDLEFQKNYTDELEKDADNMENKRKEILDKARATAKKESMKEDIEFKVGDVVKVPYKYGSYTPGEFTEAPIIDISEGRYVTVEIPSKLEVTMDQLKKWNTLGECDKSLKEDSYDSGIFYEIEQAFEEAGLNPIRFIDDGILTRNIGWTVSSNGVSQQISCDGSWYDEDEDEDDEEYNESLKEEYSEKFGGDPKDFIGDLISVKYQLSKLNLDGFGSHLARQMVEDFIDTCDRQIEKAKRLASGNEFYTEADNRTYKDRDEAEYYRNKELYANSNLARHREAMEKAKKACEEKGIKLDEDNYLSRTRKQEPLDLVAYEPEITSIDEVKDKYVKIRGDFHKVIDVKPEGDKFVISFAAGTGTAIGGEFEPATLDEIKRLQLYTENK
jgi:hypothetical protein